MILIERITCMPTRYQNSIHMYENWESPSSSARNDSQRSNGSLVLLVHIHKHCIDDDNDDGRSKAWRRKNGALF